MENPAPFLRHLLIAWVLPLALVAAVVVLARSGTGAVAFLPTRPAPTDTPSPTPTPTQYPTLTPTPRPTATPTLSPTPSPTPRPPTATPVVYKGPDDVSLSLVTKTQGLPSNYAPQDLISLNALGVPTYNNDAEELRLQPAMDLAEMLAIALQEGHALTVRSAYRSYATQAATFELFVQEELRLAENAGQPISREEAESRANRYSARPGYSQHQLGTTVDVTGMAVAGELVTDFGQTPAGLWLRDNAHRFGFVFSYPAGKESLTGYTYEPWHLRWIGRGHSEMLHALDYLSPSNAMTLDVYLAGLQ